MAQAFAVLYGGDKVEALSAGSRPSGTVNPRAIAAMRELGYDLGAHTTKGIDDLPSITYDAVVTMGCGEACPAVPTKRRIDWQIPDPTAFDKKGFRQVRDMIGEKVKALLEELGVYR